MNIVFVGTFAMSPKGTMSARSLPIAQALVRRGHRVALVVPPWDNPADGGAVWEAEGVRIINVALPPSVPLAWYGRLTWRMLRQVSALQPDILHAFKPKGFSGVVAQATLAQRAATRGRIRVLVDTDDWEGAGGWNDREPYPWWQRALFAYQEGWLLRHADAVTAASRTLAGLAAEARKTEAQVFYVPNGASGPPPTPEEGTAKQLRAKLGAPAGAVVLLYTRFVEFSPERAVQLLQAVARRESCAAVLLVGTGLKGEEKSFLARARQQLSVPVVDAGWVPQEELSHYFALADAAIFPMDDTLLNRAKCPAKLVDLLSAGVPVVAEAVGQCLEYIEDGRTGLLVRPGDTDAFADSVAKLLRQPDLRGRLGREAKARMSASYTWERLAVRFEEAYRS